MVVLVALFAIGVFVSVIALIVRVSGRRFPGDITGDHGREIDYDEPYVGWRLLPGERRDDVHAGAPEDHLDDFAQWETEVGPGHER